MSPEPIVDVANARSDVSSAARTLPIVLPTSAAARSRELEHDIGRYFMVGDRQMDDRKACHRRHPSLRRTMIGTGVRHFASFAPTVLLQDLALRNRAEWPARHHSARPQ
jgi:hypothetical protein